MIVLHASCGFQRADHQDSTRVKEGVNPAVIPLPTTTCEESAFSKDTQDTLRRASPVYSFFKFRPQLLTADGYIIEVDVHDWTLKSTQISDLRMDRRAVMCTQLVLSESNVWATKDTQMKISSMHLQPQRTVLGDFLAVVHYCTQRGDKIILLRPQFYGRKVGKVGSASTNIGIGRSAVT